MNKNVLEDNVFSELEADISGDWENIQKRVKKIEKETILKEKRKSLNELKEKPKRFHLPVFSEFYSMLVDIVGNYGNKNSDHILKYLAHKIVHNHSSDNLPKSIINIWEALCNPREYDVREKQCRRCRKKHDVIFRENRSHMMNRITMEVREFGENPFSYNQQSRTKRVFCPSCGELLLSLYNADLISVLSLDRV